MFAGLRHDAVVGRDDEQGEVDAGRPGEHVLDEPLVPRHVHDAQRRRVAEVEVGEPDVDGDAAGLLFGQAVAVDAGEGLDERRLAVVDVAGGAQYDLFQSVALLQIPMIIAACACAGIVCESAVHQDIWPVRRHKPH